MITADDIKELQKSVEDVCLPSGYMLVVSIIRTKHEAIVLPDAARQARRSDFYLVVGHNATAEAKAAGFGADLKPGSIISSTVYAGVSMEIQGRWFLKMEVNPRETGAIITGALAQWVRDTFDVSTEKPKE